MIRQGYVATVHTIGRTLRRRRWLAPPEDGGERRSRTFVRSLFVIHDLDGMLELDVPWWTFAAADEVSSFLRERPGARVFEYGSGASTAWLARRAGEVHSVEHDRDWAQLLGDRLAADPAAGSVRLHHRPPVPSPHPRTPSARRGHGGLDFTDYVATVDEVGGDFDLVVVDGRARGAALHAATAHLRPGGIVVFDNADRRRYQADLAASGLRWRRRRGLTPCLPYPTVTAIGSP